MVNEAPNLPGLDDRAVGQLCAGDARGEAEVVLDLRRRRRLTSGGDSVEYDGRQPLRGAVHRRRQPRWTGADNQQVTRTLGGGAQADQAC